ncbi:hypothetical protein N7519_004203 [Penicillium mononematosum]|uniref:uncharacterized protein n=1 Tax=Penicillium mononematosum TaxID=268346 RepID=UPI002549796A|nr:uncharacterized protein N7519_004203 [Penicillium mononematosum]KAJ6189295.1 hypothetical protein N7519_004203 [Penicillium mononematosum]
MPFRKLRKNLKKLFLKARRAVSPNGNANLPQVAETERASNASQVPSLETLPAELRRHILLRVAIDSLKALVQASPIYFHQYRLDRKHILCQSLELTLVRKQLQISSIPTTQYWVNFYLTLPSLQIAQHGRCHVYGQIPLLDVQPLMQCFVTRASSNLTETKGFQIGETSSGTGYISRIRRIEESLSRTNDTQLMGAFYRFQFCCNVYGFESLDSVALNIRIATPARILKYFLYHFQRYDVSCLSYFSEKKCRQIDHNITRDLRKRSPGFDRRPWRNDGNTHKDNSDGSLTTPICRGLELLHFVYSKIKDNDELITVTKYCMIGFSAAFPAVIAATSMTSYDGIVCVKSGKRYQEGPGPIGLLHTGWNRHPSVCSPNGSSVLQSLAWMVAWVEVTATSLESASPILSDNGGHGRRLTRVHEFRGGDDEAIGGTSGPGKYHWYLEV